jgi:peroxidase
MGTSRDTDAPVAAIVLLIVMTSMTFVARAQNLTSDYYDESCPSLFSIVEQQVQTAVANEARMAASLVRLHFHDCFVQGCDASVLLRNATGIESEQCAFANKNSLRGFDVIDTIKSAVEAACPNTVSCADILALTSHDSAIQAGLTNNYTVLLGRRDSLTSAGINVANQFLPSPLMNHTLLVQNFANVTLNETDLVALSGAHTIGRVNCLFLTGPTAVLDALNNININSNFNSSVTQACDANGTSLQNLDLTTPDTFDNSYYSNIQTGEGILISDQTLYNTSGALSVSIVDNFAANQDQFFTQFALSTIKMGNISPLTGTQGEIRTDCKFVNSNSSAQRLVATE